MNNTETEATTITESAPTKQANKLKPARKKTSKRASTKQSKSEMKKSAKTKSDAKKAQRASATKTDSKERADTKKATVLEMLRRKEGATTAEIAKATDWQNHSIRGFISGTVTKKMGMRVESMRNEAKERTYRITG